MDKKNLQMNKSLLEIFVIHLQRAQLYHVLVFYNMCFNVLLCNTMIIIFFNVRKLDLIRKI